MQEGRAAGKLVPVRLFTLVVLSLTAHVSGLHAQTSDARSQERATAPVPVTLRWGPQRPDLIRFNRVEALSVGARAQVRPSTFAGPVSVTATARLGLSDLEPNARIDVTSETLHRRVTLSAFNELTSLDPEARALGPANSITAFTVGRDDGDYYYRTGASLEWTTPSAERRAFRIGTYAELHRAAEVEHSFNLLRSFDDTWRFRPNLTASEVWEVGVVAALSPWWGTDPRLLRGGVDVEVRAATGDAEYARAAVTGVLIAPLGSAASVSVSASAGTTKGTVVTQRLFYVGGARTLRGYAPRTMGGTSFGRAGVEVQRTFPFGGLIVFSDLGWAGERTDAALSDALFSIGAGVALVDGLIRVDVARGMRGLKDVRVDLYLDSLR